MYYYATLALLLLSILVANAALFGVRDLAFY